MKKHLVFCIAIFLAIISMSPLRAQPDKREIVFSKTSSSSQHLVVTRQAVPYVPPTKAQMAELNRTNPGSFFHKPDKVWLYSLQIQKQKNKHSLLLWNTQMPEIEALPSASLEVLDAAYNGEVAVVVYREAMSVVAEVTRKRNSFIVARRTEVSVRNMELTQVPFKTPMVLPTNIRISLSRSPERIAVALTDPQGKPRRFLWNTKGNKWLEQKSAKTKGKTLLR